MCVCVQEPSLVSVFKLCCFCAYVLFCSIFILTFMWTFTHASTHTHTQSEIQAHTHTHTEIQTRTPNLSHRPPLGKCIRQGNKPSLTSHHHSYSSHEHTMWSNKALIDCMKVISLKPAQELRKVFRSRNKCKTLPYLPFVFPSYPYWTTVCTKFSFLHIS